MAQGLSVRLTPPTVAAENEPRCTEIVLVSQKISKMRTRKLSTDRSAKAGNLRVVAERRSLKHIGP